MSAPTQVDIATRRAELIAAAMDYAKRGWRITPVWWITADLDGERACACWKKERCGKKSGKHPLFEGWRDSATSDTAQIHFWWHHRPLAGIGLVMGGAARLVAIDIDGTAGRESLVALEALHGALPTTWTQVSGRPDGGEHRVFTVPANLDIDYLRNRVKVAPGIDIRATGGFIVGAPSEHISGSKYAVTINTSPADLPPWLFWLIADKHKAAKARMQIAGAGRPPENELPSMQERIDRGVGLCKAHRPAIQGENGSATLMSLCAALVRGLCLPMDTAVKLLTEHYNEVCEPEWSDEELLHKVADAETVSVKEWRFLIDEEMDAGRDAADVEHEPRRGSPNGMSVPPPDASDSGAPVRQQAEGTPISNVTSASLTSLILGGGPCVDLNVGHVATPHQHWRSPSGFNQPVSTEPEPGSESEPGPAMPDPDRISIAPSLTPPKSFVSYATCEILRSTTKDGQHHLQLRVLDGRLRGIKKDWPLDWPMTSRSQSKWQHLGEALGIAEITHPRDTYHQRFRAELVKNADGVVEVHRSYPAIAAATTTTAAATNIPHP